MSDKHPTHKTRFSFDASSWDEMCVNCHNTDHVPGGWGRLADPCPMACACPWAPEAHAPFEDVPTAEAFSKGWNLVVAVHYFDPENKARLVIVSRKDDRTKFCTPGGKVDPCDWNGIERTAENAELACRRAACREALEEAGLVIDDPERDLERVLGTPCFGDGRLHHRFAVQYVAKKATPTMKTFEPIDVRWGRKKDVVSGPFGDVYSMVYAKLGIDRQYDLE